MNKLLVILFNLAILIAGYQKYTGQSSVATTSGNLKRAQVCMHCVHSVHSESGFEVKEQ